MDVKLRNKARKYLERMSEPHKSAVIDALDKNETLVIETADADEIKMIEEGMREYEDNPSSFTDWKTVKKELGLN